MNINALKLEKVSDSVILYDSNIIFDTIVQQLNNNVVLDKDTGKITFLSNGSYYVFWSVLLDKIYTPAINYSIKLISSKGDEVESSAPNNENEIVGYCTIFVDEAPVDIELKNMTSNTKILLDRYEKRKATLSILDITDVISSLDGTGPKGPKGPIGPLGLQGNIGDIGPTGPMGIKGPLNTNSTTGVTGATGPLGPAGLEGEIGPEGPPGLPGISGVPGLIGNPGPTGAIGPSGLPGPQGPIGSDGPDGPFPPCSTLSYIAKNSNILSGTSIPLSINSYTFAYPNYFTMEDNFRDIRIASDTALYFIKVILYVRRNTGDTPPKIRLLGHPVTSPVTPATELASGTFSGADEALTFSAILKMPSQPIFSYYRIFLQNASATSLNVESGMIAIVKTGE